MKLYFAVFTLLIFNVSNIAFASSVSGTISYEYTKQFGQAKQLTPDATFNLSCDLNKHLSFNGTFESNRTNDQPATNTVNNANLEYKNANYNYIIGKQCFTLSNGLIASISGVNGIHTDFTAPDRTTTIFYEKYSKSIVAVDLALNKPGTFKNLMFETSYFQDSNRYMGMTFLNKITKDTSLTVETTDNLNAEAFGYLITWNHGSTQKTGDTAISVSYRNIKPEAVSEYCVDSNYNNSKGFRIALNSKIGKKIILTAYHDIAESQSKTNIDKTYIALSNNF